MHNERFIVNGIRLFKQSMLFDGRWKDPERTETAFRGNCFSAGDLGMPRSGANKILHRALREKYGMWKDRI